MFARLCCSVWIGVLAAGAVSCSKSAAEYIHKGDTFIADKKYAEAVIQYRNAIVQDGGSGQAHYKLAEALRLAGEEPKAVTEYVRAADLLPDDIQVQMSAARALLLAGAMDDARSRAELIIGKDPRNVDAHILRGSAAAGLKDLTSALTTAEDAVRIDPNRSDVYVNLAAVQLMKGQYERAESAFKQAVAVNPKSVAANLSLSSFYAATGNQVEAEKWAKAALALDPGGERANRALARLYSSTGRFTDLEAPLKAVAAASKRAQDQLALGDYYVYQKRYADARRVMTALMDDPHAGAAARARLAGVEYAEGHRDRAHAMVDDLLAKAPRDVQFLVVKGGWLLSEKKLTEALAVAEKAVAADPMSADAHGLLGSVQLALGSTDEALKAFTQSVALSPGSVRGRLELAMLHLDKGRPVPAEQFAQDIVNEQPANGVARFVLVRALLAQGKIDRARVELQPLLPTNTSHLGVQLLVGEIAYRKGERAAAARAFNRALEIAPASIEALSWLVQLDVADKQIPSAHRRVQEQLATAPNDPQLLLLSSRTFMAAGDTQAAEVALKRAIEADPSIIRAYQLLGRLYIGQRRLGQALQEYDALSQRQPRNVGAHTMVAMLLHVQNKTDEARERYERVLAIDPAAAVAANNLAYMDAEAERNLEVALSRAQAAKAVLPDDADVSDTLGWVFYKRNLAQSAIPHLQFSAGKDPRNPTYQYHLGLAYLKAGDKAKAKAALGLALALNPAFDEAADAKRVLASING